MAIKTITAKAGGGVDYSPGWKKLKISNAKYGTYNTKKYIDIWFDGYSDNLNARVYETVNKKTNEEFKISNWFGISFIFVFNLLSELDCIPGAVS